jgi:hypothetical protein
MSTRPGAVPPARLCAIRLCADEDQGSVPGSYHASEEVDLGGGQEPHFLSLNPGDDLRVLLKARKWLQPSDSVASVVEPDYVDNPTISHREDLPSERRSTPLVGSLGAVNHQANEKLVAVDGDVGHLGLDT